MNNYKKLFLSLLLGVFAAGELGAQVVSEVTVIKSSEWLQTSTAAPILNPRPYGPGSYGGPYSFSVNVRGTGLSGITAPTVTLPAGSLYPTQNPTRHNGGVLAYNPNDPAWAYGVDANGYGAPTAADRDGAFAAGTYGLTVMGTSFNLSLPDTAFGPNTPSVTLTGGTWVRGVYMINVNQALTITTNAFTHFGNVGLADSAMTLNIWGINEQTMFSSVNPTVLNSLTYTIPANTLVAGTDYTGEAGFYSITSTSTAIANSLNAAAHARTTLFKIRAYTGTLPSATLSGIGDLPGGIVSSEVRDVARVNNVLFAVGAASANSGSTGRDTAVLWTSTDGLIPLPNLVTNTTATNFVTASAITPDAAYITGRARTVTPGGVREAVRVTTYGLTNLSFGGLADPTANSFGSAISSDGSVIYGVAKGNTQAARFTASGPTGTLIPILNSYTSSSIAARGSSSDGSIAVGTCFTSNTRGAFRYVHGTGISAIPFLPGGVWNQALAVSPDGNLTLLVGNSPNGPNYGEFYLHNATTSALTPLGMPNGSWGSYGLAGMTTDGSVVALNTNDLPLGGTASFIRNSTGWHNFQSVVAGAGVNLSGWTLDPVQGMSSDGTLVWGMGTHNGNSEGFVVEFASGYLAGYTEPATYSTPGAAIVGAWSFGDTTTDDSGVLIFLPNGYYLHIQDVNAADVALDAADGFEIGQYTWDSITGAFTSRTLRDTNGGAGVSGVDGKLGVNVAVAGNTATVSKPNDPQIMLSRVVGTSPAMGAWVTGDVRGTFTALALLANGTYFQVQDGPASGGGTPGIEHGTYSLNPGTGVLTATALVDTNSAWGFSPAVARTVATSVDLLTLTLTTPGGPTGFTRVGAVAAPAVSAQPANASAQANGTTTFTVAVSGAPLPTYQWQVSTDGGSTWNNLADGGAYSGVTLATLTVTPTLGMNGYRYRNVATSALGTATSNAVTLTVGARTNTGFNGDAKSDILWSNTTTGERAVWFMDGSNYTGGTSLGVVPVAWSISAVNDFNGDGQADIFLSNTSTGDRAVWVMNGTTIATNAFLGTIPTDWVVSATGDFNGDGKADVFWTDTATGNRAVWLMNGGAYIGGGFTGTVPVAWVISGTGDFNADGKADILWSNTSTGERAVWFMDGSNYTGGTSLGVVPVAWTVSAVNDFNGDGKADIFLSNTSTGDRAVWVMNGTAIATNAFLGTIPTNWVISTSGDYNGDGKADVFWTDTATGNRAVWLMNGGAYIGGGFTGTVPVDWLAK